MKWIIDFLLSDLIFTQAWSPGCQLSCCKLTQCGAVYVFCFCWSQKSAWGVSALLSFLPDGGMNCPSAIGEWTLEVINNYDYCFYLEKLLRSWDNIYIRVVLIMTALPFLSYSKCCVSVARLMLTLSKKWFVRLDDQGLKISCPLASPVVVYQLCFAPNYVGLDTQRKHGLGTEHYLNKGAKAKQCLNVVCQLGQCCKSWICVGSLGCLRTCGCVKSRLDFNTSCCS